MLIWVIILDHKLKCEKLNNLNELANSNVLVLKIKT